MMKSIRKAAKLLKIYTNHSLRATVITIWSNAGVPNRNIRPPESTVVWPNTTKGLPHPESATAVMYYQEVSQMTAPTPL